MFLHLTHSCFHITASAFLPPTLPPPDAISARPFGHMCAMNKLTEWRMWMCIIICERIHCDDRLARMSAPINGRTDPTKSIFSVSSDVCFSSSNVYRISIFAMIRVCVCWFARKFAIKYWPRARVYALHKFIRPRNEHKVKINQNRTHAAHVCVCELYFVYGISIKIYYCSVHSMRCTYDDRPLTHANTLIQTIVYCMQ